MVSSIHTEYEYSKVIHLLYKSRTNSLVVLKIIYRVRVVIVPASMRLCSGNVRGDDIFLATR